MSDQRGKNWNWKPLDETGNAPNWERVGICVLLDIRDELQELNRVLRCPNFQDIPARLERIARSVARPRRPKNRRTSHVA